MKSDRFSNYLNIAACLMIASAVTFTDAWAEKAATEQVAAPAMSEEMMAKWKEYATPNENHQILNGLVGSWDYTSKHWMSPESPAEESSGTAEGKWIMDGRFVAQTFQGIWMDQPFTGIQTTGYDNADKEYASTWLDNMGTGMMVATGSYDPATKTLTQAGNFNCPFRGKMSMRWVTKFVDDNTYVFEMYSPDDNGVEFKGMEITYTKKQG